MNFFKLESLAHTLETKNGLCDLRNIATHQCTGGRLSWRDVFVSGFSAKDASIAYLLIGILLLQTDSNTTKGTNAPNVTSTSSCLFCLALNERYTNFVGPGRG